MCIRIRYLYQISSMCHIVNLTVTKDGREVRRTDTNASRNCKALSLVDAILISVAKAQVVAQLHHTSQESRNFRQLGLRLTVLILDINDASQMPPQRSQSSCEIRNV
jgi:hypothetical protein